MLIARHFTSYAHEFMCACELQQSSIAATQSLREQRGSRMQTVAVC